MFTTPKPGDRWIIKDGPTAGLIFDKAKYAYDSRVTITAEFTVIPEISSRLGWDDKINPEIRGVSHEDGSGQSLVIEGYFDQTPFVALYHARRREGQIDFS